MPIPLGIWATAGAGAAAGAYEQIATQILGSATSTVTFSSINQTYTHLQLRYVGKTDRDAGHDQMRIRFNGDAGSNYAIHLLGINTNLGSAVSSSSATSRTGIDDNSSYIAGNTTPQIFGSGVIDILDYKATTKNKTTRHATGFVTAANHYTINQSSGLWMSTAAITSLSLTPVTGTNFVAGSRFSLYGIKG